MDQKDRIIRRPLIYCGPRRSHGFAVGEGRVSGFEGQAGDEDADA
jgi:hypothetical protein